MFSLLSEMKLDAIDMSLEMEACIADASRALNDVGLSFRRYSGQSALERKFNFYSEASIGEFFKGLFGKIKNFIIMLINTLLKVLNWFLSGVNTVFGTELQITLIGKDKVTASGTKAANDGIDKANNEINKRNVNTSNLSGLLAHMYSGNLGFIRDVFDGETGFEFLGNLPIVDSIERIVSAGEGRDLLKNSMIEEGIIDILREFINTPTTGKTLKDIVSGWVKSDTVEFTTIKQVAEKYRASFVDNMSYKKVLQDIFTSKGMGASAQKLLERYKEWRETATNAGVVKGTAKTIIEKLMGDLSEETIKDFMGSYFREIDNLKYVNSMSFADLTPGANGAKSSKSHIDMLVNRINALKSIVVGLETNNFQPLLDDMKNNGYARTPASVEDFQKNMSAITSGYVAELNKDANVNTKSGKPKMKNQNNTYSGQCDVNAAKAADGSTMSSIEVVKYTFTDIKFRDAVTYSGGALHNDVNGVESSFKNTTAGVKKAMENIEAMKKSMDEQATSAKPESKDTEAGRSKELIFAVVKSISENVKHNVQQFMDIIKACRSFYTLAQLTTHNLTVLKAMFATYCGLIIENYYDAMVTEYKNQSTEEKLAGMYEEYSKGRNAFYSGLKLK